MKILDIINEADVAAPGWRQTLQRAMDRMYSRDPTHRQAAREALNRLQVILKQNYGQGAKFEPTDEETIERLAKATETMNNLAQFLLAGRKPNPMESSQLAEGKRKRRKKTRLQKLYGRTRGGFGGYYYGGYGGMGGDNSSDGSGDGGDGGGGDGGGGS